MRVKKYDIYGNTRKQVIAAEQREIGEIRVGDYLAIMNAVLIAVLWHQNIIKTLTNRIYIYNNEFFLSRQKLTHSELAERILFDYGIK